MLAVDWVEHWDNVAKIQGSLARGEACPEKGGSIVDNDVWLDCAYDDLLDSGKVVMPFILRVGDGTGLLEASVEDITGCNWLWPYMLNWQLESCGGWRSRRVATWEPWMNSTSWQRSEGRIGWQGLALPKAENVTYGILDIPLTLHMQYYISEMWNSLEATPNIPRDSRRPHRCF